jgi:hypothetical protein
MNLIPSCPEWPLVNVYYRGHWTNAAAELFAPTEDSPPSHLHIYNRAMWEQGQREAGWKVPPSVVTYSLAEDAG